MSPRLRWLHAKVSTKMPNHQLQKMPSLWLPTLLPSASTTRLLAELQRCVPPSLLGKVQSLRASSCASRDRVDGNGQGDGCAQRQHAPRRSGDPMANPLRHQPAVELDHVAGARAVLHPERQIEVVPGHLRRRQAKRREADPMDTARQRKPALSIHEDARGKLLDRRGSFGKGAGCARWQ